MAIESLPSMAKGEFKSASSNNGLVVNGENNLSKVLHMSSGGGESSYAQNSSRQSSVFKSMQPTFHRLIQSLPLQNTGGLLQIADMGCANGMNTVSEVDFVVTTIKKLYSKRGLSIPQLQVFFNDLPSNDFNGLFMLLNSLKPDYMAAGVAGSFYQALFPDGTINICFSIMALHWLSQVPEGVGNEGSCVYNRGKVWINGGRAEVARAYAEQSQKDLREFFRWRGEEMASGGVMFICAMGRPNGVSAEQQVTSEGEYCGPDFEAAWDDLISEGIVKAETRDSFNLPWYFPNADEMREAVEASGAFEIVKLEVCSGVCCMGEGEFEEWVRDVECFGKKKARLVRSFVGSLVEDAIGVENCNALFERMEKRSSEMLEKGLLRPSRFVPCIVAALVRK
ncbi:gibberellic acid methyltransferase 2-like [Cryptomeria japonica]|uniref:gibberellic acid methyltransferase 2-like n=1 Tax=Cryptomeria japonica TaxID=3369 RepID=UPI0027D9D3D9|nr:gibberellic acid methyltransferase 2-like [Cryptomeria japonica]